MSLYKAVIHGKEHRKLYHGAKAVDSSSRNHGDDPWTQGNVRHKRDKQMKNSKYEAKELNDYAKK